MTSPRDNSETAELRQLLAAQNQALKGLCFALVKLQTALAQVEQGASSEASTSNREASEFVDQAFVVADQVEQKLRPD